MKAYMRKVSDHTKYKNFGDYVDYTQLDLEDGYEWAFGELPDNATPDVVLNPLETMDSIISSGIEEFLGDPLPPDIEMQILQLSVYVRQYFQFNRIGLIRQTIENYSIPENRDDVNPDQRQKIDFLKAQLLELFPDE